jgi:formylglycine-generating enzyme
MRTASLLGAVVIVSLVFAACGSDSQTGAPSGSGGAGGEATLPGGGDAPNVAGSSTAGSAQGGSGQGEAGSGGDSAGMPGEAGATTGMGGGGSEDACPSEKGSPMVRLPADAGGFCIDAHEATRAEYAAFLANLDALAPQPPVCSFNSGDGAYIPTKDYGNDPNMELPQTGVDWCDARAYCDWAGKRLCGKIGGGSVPFDSFNDASVSQWQAACSRGGTRIFPYGNEYQGATCNGFEANNGALISATDPTCEGGYPGIYNMSGNAWEWEDACDGTAGNTDKCRLRSGEFSNPEGFLRCDYGGFFIERTFNVSGTVGIRCCGP